MLISIFSSLRNTQHVWLRFKYNSYRKLGNVRTRCLHCERLTKQGDANLCAYLYRVSENRVKKKRKIRIRKGIYYTEEIISPFTNLKLQALFTLVSMFVHAPPSESLVVMMTVQQEVDCVLWLVELRSVTRVQR